MGEAKVESSDYTEKKEDNNWLEKVNIVGFIEVSMRDYALQKKQLLVKSLGKYLLSFGTQRKWSSFDCSIA